MGKRKRRSSYQYNHTSTTLLMALFGGACAFIAVETTLPDLIESWGAPDKEAPRMASSYGIGVQWNHDILHIFVHSGSIRNKVTHNSVEIECTVVASRWAHLVGNNHPYPLLHCDPGRNHLWCMGLPPNF
jgi:hypothetical protein